MANCTITWNPFKGELPDSLIQVFIFYCLTVCLIGILCNVLALWCVVGCSRTPRSVKVLLCGLFSTCLLTCLLVMPFMAYVGVSKMYCDRLISFVIIQVMSTLYVVLTEMELLYITIIALLRALAVWSSRRRQVKMRTAVALSLGIAIFSIGITLLLRLAHWCGILTGHVGLVLLYLYNVVNFFLPMVFTMVCYLSMLFAVRRNRQRLAAIPDSGAAGKVMDQATRAMLAVFLSNLALSLPHSIYHILPNNYHVFNYVIMHIVFFTHLFVDPLAFMCSNLHHRQRILHALKSCPQWVSCRPLPAFQHATSTLPLHVTPSTSSNDPQQEQY